VGGGGGVGGGGEEEEGERDGRHLGDKHHRVLRRARPQRAARRAPQVPEGAAAARRPCEGLVLGGSLDERGEVAADALITGKALL